MRKLSFVLLLALAAACDDGSSEPEEESSGTYGTCDLRAVQSTCIESTGPAPSIANQETGCLDAGGSWSESPCPDADVGCCTYTFGLDFRECWYTGTANQDPAASCAQFDGTWTPGT